MAPAVAIRCDELTDDLARFEAITVKCHQCDEDNPRAVPQEKCPECQGTGRSRIKLVGIVREVREARTAPRRGDHCLDDELFLEY
jgi:hypothetical protein